MYGRYPLLIAVAVSLLLHAALIGVGELLSGGDAPRPAREEFDVQYFPPERTKSVAERAERAERDERDEAPSERSISLETPDPVYRPYFTTLTGAIERAWQDPVLKREDPAAGKVVVTFTLGAGGELQAVSVERSSGVRGMDLAAVQAVKKAAPFEEIPPEIATGELTVQALFVYD